MESALNKLKPKLGEENYQKLNKINNSSLYEFIEKYVELCNLKNIRL